MELERKKIFIWIALAVGAVLLITAVFSVTLWILGKMTEPSKKTGEFPEAPLSVNFPEAPSVIRITKLYFNGPYFLKDRNIASDSIFSILCPREGGYDIIYIGDTGEGYQLSTNPNAGCWKEKCPEDLKVAFFWMPLSKYKLEEIRKLRILIETDNQPVCSNLTL